MRSARLVGLPAAALVGLLGTAALGGEHRGLGSSLNRGADPGAGPIAIPRAPGILAEQEKPGQSATGCVAGSGRHPAARPCGAVRLSSQDPRSGRLYISHMNDAHVEVFDTRSRTVVARIAATPRVTGVLAVPELGKLYASVAGRHHVAVIDLDRLTVRATPGPIGFPDGLAYAPEARRIFVSDEAGGGELVINGVTDRIVARIPLGGEAGNTKLTPARAASWWPFRPSTRSSPSIRGRPGWWAGISLRARIILRSTWTAPAACFLWPTRGTRRCRW